MQAFILAKCKAPWGKAPCLTFSYVNPSQVFTCFPNDFPFIVNFGQNTSGF
jgi:hypothetical protein